MNNFTVYIHKNKTNGKVYIGQTKQNPIKRWDNGRGYKDCSRFWNAIQKYGWDNFEHIILATDLTLEEANLLEEKLIKDYNSTNPQNGYNINFGGFNHNHSEETKRKIGESNKISQLNKKWSDHQREIISEKFSGKGNPFYGKHHTEETKKKISEHRKGKNVGNQHPFYGKHHSDDSLDKISNNRKSKGGKRVLCINTGEIFPTMMDAARWCGLTNSSSIGQVCNHTGKQKTAGKHPKTGEKLKWEFIDDKKNR